ncbi:MAG: DUF6817 domain-containing protein [Myxococcota bacterium]
MEPGGARASTLRERIRAAPRHSGVAFEAHLEGTAALLRAWGCRRELELAGRYHSVYGNTQGRAALASRAARELMAEIGAEAEQLVWLWARLDRESLATAARLARRRNPGDPIELPLVTGEVIAVSARVHLDLVQLHAANELEQAARTGDGCRLLEPLRPWLCAGARAQLDQQRRPSRLASWCRRLVLETARVLGAR